MVNKSAPRRPHTLLLPLLSPSSPSCRPSPIPTHLHVRTHGHSPLPPLHPLPPIHPFPDPPPHTHPHSNPTPKPHPHLQTKPTTHMQNHQWMLRPLPRARSPPGVRSLRSPSGPTMGPRWQCPRRCRGQGLSSGTPFGVPGKGCLTTLCEPTAFLACLDCSP